MRPLVAGSVAAAALVLSACSSVEGTDTAASVGDGEISVEQFESLVQALTENEDATGVSADPVTGTVAGDQARNLLGLLIEDEANTQFLAAHGESITEDDRQQLLDTVPEDEPLLDLPADVVQLAVDTQVAPTARGRVAVPEGDELRQRYEEDPSSLAVLCVRHVLVDTEAEAQAVANEIAAGTPIEDLARDLSTDDATAGNGGAIESTDGSACLDVPTARQTLDAAFVDAALTSRPGEPVGPVETPFGWHVIEARPYDEIADSLNALYAQDSAPELLFAAFVAGTDIRVDPRYGRWDTATNSVVAL